MLRFPLSRLSRSVPLQSGCAPGDAPTMTQVCGSRRQGARGIPAAPAARDREGAEAAPRRPLPLHRPAEFEVRPLGPLRAADEMGQMQWVRPELVAQIRFVEWTADSRLRHAAFLGLRSDKGAREVRREAHEVTS